MDNEKTTQVSPSKEYVSEIIENLTDPVHRRIIQAYKDANPVQSMESELVTVIREILNRED